MAENPCLRPACLSDVMTYDQYGARHLHEVFRHDPLFSTTNVLQALYDAEWQKRGYRRSP